MKRREFIGAIGAAAVATALPLTSQPVVKCFFMGECDYIAAYSKEQAREWYREVWCGVDYELDEITEVPSSLTVYDEGEEPYTLADEITDNIALGGEFPIYLATDGHYC